jgi:hypothetical protein
MRGEAAARQGRRKEVRDLIFGCWLGCKTGEDGMKVGMMVIRERRILAWDEETWNLVRWR